METASVAPQLFSLFTTAGIGIVILVSVLFLRRYKEPFFSKWTRGYICVQLSIVLETIAAFRGRSPVLSVLTITVYVAGIWFFLGAGFNLQLRPLPARITVAAVALLCACLGLYVSGHDVPVAVAPAAVAFGITFIWFGTVLLTRPGPAEHRGAHWMAWPIIIKGGWIFAYPIMVQTQFAWAGYWLDGVLHILVSIGMVVYFLERNSAQLQLLIDEIRNHAFFMVNTSGLISSWNSGASRLHGYRLDDIIGKPLAWLYTGEDRNAGTPERDLRFVAEHDFFDGTGWRVCEDGRTFWAHTIISPIRSHSGRLDGFSVLIHDVSDRKQIEDERFRLATAVEQSADSVIITDACGQIQYGNPAFERASGRSGKMISGTDVVEFARDEQDPRVAREIRRAIAAARVWTGRFTSRSADGKLMTEDATLSPIRDQEGRLINFILIKRDVTQEVTLAEQLRQAQKMEGFGQLASGVAHDFGNLLAVIIGFNHLLKTKPPTPELISKCTAAISRATEQATMLIRQLMAFSRRDVFNPQVIDLNTSVGQSTRMLSRLIGEEISLRTDTSSVPCMVRADVGQLEQVMMNLVVNARDAMPDGGTIIIRTSVIDTERTQQVPDPDLPPGRYVLLSVRDTGIGIDAETITRIFEPFFTTKPAGKGTGLGLSIVFGVVQQSGGQLRVSSSPGEGTVFRIYLPYVDEAELAAEEPAPLPDNARGTETVLVVEDDVELRGIVRRLVQEHGYQVLEAARGEDALRLCDEHTGQLDLLLTDVVMPGMGGRQLAEALSQRYPAMRVLYMTGYTDDAIIRQGVSNATANLIAKPFEPGSLIRKMREVLKEDR